MSKISLKKQLIIQGIEIYKPGDRCWLDYQITKDNPLTFHHIIPERNGFEGKTIITNMALLTKKAHSKFNLIERKNPIIAKQLNREFKILNESMLPPTDEYYDKIHYYLEKFENKRVRMYIK